MKSNARPGLHGWRRSSSAGKVDNIVKTLRAFSTPSTALAELIENEADFFERNSERMRYAQFRAQKLFVGSGVVEAGCKTVIGRRLKMSGMFSSGPFEAPSPSSLCAATASAENLLTIGSLVLPDLYKHVAHPGCCPDLRRSAIWLIMSLEKRRHGCLQSKTK
jgi:hypothetical protein